MNDFHPGLRLAARLMPRGGLGPRTLRPVRALMGLPTHYTPKGVEVLTLASGTGVRLYRHGGADPAPALLWLHGGGYALGHAAHDDLYCRRLSRELGITVASVEYRLAPEHPYPAALHDGYAALTWLAGLPAVDAGRLAIGGGSAGGGLAAALALLARDRGGITPALQLLVYPMLDDRSAALPANKNYRLWNPRNNAIAWQWYLGDADPQIAVPGRRTDLAGLPPAWLGAGSQDLFYAETVSYAQRLRDAGVDCHLETVPGAFHGFDRLVPTAAVSRAFFASLCAALETAFRQRV